jgi:1-acyl-sn-glycerol-3-phosphate acyltransferase
VEPEREPATPARAARPAPPPFEAGPGDSPPERLPQTLWEWLRALARGVGIALWTAAIVGIWMAGRPFRRSTPQQANAWRGWATRQWGGGILRLMNARLEVSGPRPEPPCCLVSNHVSYLDIFVYHRLLAARFEAKTEVSDWPAMGWLARTFGTVFLDRSRPRDLVRVLGEMREAAQQGDAIIFFPEGTTSSGEDLLPFRAPLMEIAARVRVPVAYAAISYHAREGAPPAEQTLAWWGEMDFLKHLLGALALPRFTIRVAFGASPLDSSDRKALAAEAEAKVRGLLEGA